MGHCGHTSSLYKYEHLPISFFPWHIGSISSSCARLAQAKQQAGDGHLLSYHMGIDSESDNVVFSITVEILSMHATVTLSMRPIN